MKYMTNKQHLLEDYKKMAKNFMTPNIREYQLTADNRIIELSAGYGIDGRKIYGVTEFTVIDGRLETTRRGQMHNTIISARRHYNNLK